MSVRMAQALGLHVSSDMGNETLSFERDYVFWSMLSQDKCWSFYVGRDQGIRDPHYDVADATINDEMDQSPWIWQYDPQQPAVEQPSYLSHSFVQQVSLMKISEAIMDVVYSMCSSRRGGLNIAKVSDVYLQLRSWEAKLPRYLHIADTSVKITRAPPHVIMVNLAFHWLSILLLRPFFRPGVTPSSGTLASPSTDATSASPQESDGHAKKTLQMLREAAAAQCPSSANQIVRLFERYDVLYGLRFTPITALQIAYTAGLIHLSMYFAATTPSVREKYRLLGVACINILNAMGQTWTSGTVTASIMKRLLENGERRLAAAALKGKTGAQENVRMVRAKKLSSSLAAPPTDPKSDIKTEPPQTSDSMDLTTTASTGQDVESVTPTSKPPNPIPIPIPSTNNAPNFGAMASSPSQIPTFQPMAPGIGIPIDLSAYNHQPTYPASSLEASVQPWMLPFLTGLGPSPVAFGPSESVSWNGEGTGLTPSSFGSTNDFSVQQLLQQSVSLTPSGWAPNGDGSIGAGIPMPMSIDEFASGAGISGTGDGTDPSGWGLEASGFDPNAWMSPPIPPASVVGADSVVRMDPYPYDGSRSEGYQV
ncbi:hypothetical protein DL93DRAFT_2078382 [Clavulina sp. PMI_390]|nr:hypothetical protein DL93DRAFT_2078382 [Clavulina sp. PMI_390]